jgi:hypothetical protein
MAWDQDGLNKIVDSLNAAASPHQVFRALDFTGHPGRECGEHRTTGQRAWCHSCTEWCYPDGPCKGCEMPQLRARVAELEAENKRLRTIEDRAERVVARIPDPDWVKAARFILDGKSGPYDPED